jgi:hypothetical protein
MLKPQVLCLPCLSNSYAVTHGSESACTRIGALVLYNLGLWKGKRIASPPVFFIWTRIYATVAKAAGVSPLANICALLGIKKGRSEERPKAEKMIIVLID